MLFSHPIIIGSRGYNIISLLCVALLYTIVETSVLLILTIFLIVMIYSTSTQPTCNFHYENILFSVGWTISSTVLVASLLRAVLISALLLLLYIHRLVSTSSLTSFSRLLHIRLGLSFHYQTSIISL